MDCRRLLNHNAFSTVRMRYLVLFSIMTRLIENLFSINFLRQHAKKECNNPLEINRKQNCARSAKLINLSWNCIAPKESRLYLHKELMSRAQTEASTEEAVITENFSNSNPPAPSVQFTCRRQEREEFKISKLQFNSKRLVRNTKNPTNRIGVDDFDYFCFCQFLTHVG